MRLLAIALISACLFMVSCTRGATNATPEQTFGQRTQVYEHFLHSVVVAQASPTTQSGGSTEVHRRGTGGGGGSQAMGAGRDGGVTPQPPEGAIGPAGSKR